MKQERVIIGTQNVKNIEALTAAQIMNNLRGNNVEVGDDIVASKGDEALSASSKIIARKRLGKDSKEEEQGQAEIAA